MADFLGLDWDGSDWDTGETGEFSDSFGKDFNGGIGSGFTRGFSAGFDTVGPLARVSRVIAEVLHQDPDPTAQVSRVITEVVHQNPNPTAQVSRVLVEVLQSQTILAEDFINLVKFELSDTSDPDVDFDHVLRVRMRKILEEHAGIVRVRLVQSPDTIIEEFEIEL